MYLDSESNAIAGVAAICRQYNITALSDFLGSCRVFAEEKTLNIAVLGRFKAGKSSFLNHLLGRPLLPVGVIPVTSVVTEMEYGPEERAEVRFLDGRAQAIPIGAIGEFVSESHNPGNQKRVATVRVVLPSMEKYRGIRFVDTPGLESVFEHNTGAALDWLPNVGLALVAVGVDPPLSQYDIELIRNLSRYTPSISILLTKVDILEERELIEVRDFVSQQLARHWNGSVPVFSYSIRPGFKELRRQLDESLLSQAQADAIGQRSAILRHKLDSLLGECADYLTVALKAAEAADSERDDLRCKILGQTEALDDARMGLRLIARHARASFRPAYEALLRPDERPVRQRLLEAFYVEFPNWAHSLRVATERFDEWLRAHATSEMAALSHTHREEFTAPVDRAGRQLSQSLQDFRNRISERTLDTLGVPLRTTELELRLESPRAPDVRVGKIFDHNWELLSWLAPMTLLRGAVRNHFKRKLGEVVSVNLSRLVTQWEKIASDSLRSIERQSLERLDGLISTIESLLTSTQQRAPQIRDDLSEVRRLRSGL